MVRLSLWTDAMKIMEQNERHSEIGEESDISLVGGVSGIPAGLFPDECSPRELFPKERAFSLFLRMEKIICIFFEEYSTK
jgi:hypothetical protein